MIGQWVMVVVVATILWWVQASDWLEDINQFVEEDENEFSYSSKSFFKAWTILWMFVSLSLSPLSTSLQFVCLLMT